MKIETMTHLACGGANPYPVDGIGQGGARNSKVSVGRGCPAKPAVAPLLPARETEVNLDSSSLKKPRTAASHGE